MITILRLGHRASRDHRISTHLGLVARSFDADKIIYSGERDGKLISSIKDVVKRWGGPFEVKFKKNWRKFLMNFDGKVVHLTMYGLSLQEKINEIRNDTKNNDLLIVVGGKKVPPEIYKTADYNIAVTNQPHSEVAALGVFLHELKQGEELEKEFENYQVKIKPEKNGKNVVEKD